MRAETARPGVSVAARAAILTIAWGGGCTLSPYPAAEAETGDRCENGIDDDFDGLVDCDDTALCVGRCAEHTAIACANEVDDDGDGLVDLADARCWAFARSEVVHCASVPATSTIGVALAETWSVYRGNVRPGGALEVCAGASLRTRDPLTGALDGTRLELTVDATADGVVWLAPIDRVGTAGPDLYSAIELELSAGGVELRGPSESQRASLPLGSAAPLITITLTLETFEAGVVPPSLVTATLTPEGELPIELSVPLPARWGAAEPLLAGVSGTSTGARCLVLRTGNITRPAFDPCGHAVPQITEPSIVSVLAAAASEDLWCAVVADADGRCASWRSLDGATWATGAPLGGGACTSAAVTWDAARGTMILAVASGTDLLRYSSNDCWTAWTVEPPLPDALPTGSALAGYAITEDRDGTWHVLDVATGTGTLVGSRSRDGSSGSFVLDDALPALPAAALTSAARARGVRVVRVGPDPVLVLADPESDGVSVWTLGATAARELVWSEVGVPWIAPSASPRTFDAWRIPSATFVARGPVVTFVHSGAGDFPCPGAACEEPAGTTVVTLRTACAGYDCGRPCEVDEDCVDSDECTASERCDPAVRRCTWDLPDLDGDGHILAACAGDDCDDSRADVFPGAYDDCGELDADCDGAPGPLVRGDFCGGGDADCDGAIDENADLAADPANCGACGTQCDVPLALTGCAASECQLTCLPGSRDADGERANGCEYTCLGVLPYETCDMTDEDCDGLVDEASSLAPDPENCGACGRRCRFRRAAAACGPGFICTLEVCRPGTFDDDGDPANGCESPTCLGYEICDGFDDDCDGRIDEMSGGEGDPCGTNVGMCTQGVVACVAGDLICVGEVAPLPEVCNGIDDDCDDFIDDGIALLGMPCGVTLGACQAGAVQCVAAALTCVGAVGPTTETCNGLDDDCDGLNDDDDGASLCGADVCVLGRCETACASGEFPCGVGQRPHQLGEVCYCR